MIQIFWPFLVRNFKIFILTGVYISFISSCGGPIIVPDPVKKMAQEFTSKSQYAILLLDMDLQGNDFKHKYRIFDHSHEEVQITTTEWIDVSDHFFYMHDDNLGMEILAKRADGKMNNLISPPGFNNIIGNVKFGNWNSKGNWEFLSEHQFVKTALGIDSLNITKTEFDDFSKKYLFNRPYYGSDKQHKYGTSGLYFIHSRPFFYTRRETIRKQRSTPSFFGSGSRGGGGFGK